MSTSQKIKCGRGQPKGSRKSPTNENQITSEALINDVTRRYGIKIKVHKAAETSDADSILVQQQHQEQQLQHQQPLDMSSSLTINPDSSHHDNFLDELEEILLSTPTALESSNVSLPLPSPPNSSPSTPTKKKHTCPPIKRKKFDIKLVSSFANDLKTVPSQKGGAKLVFQGAYFNKDSQNKTKQTSYYQCDQKSVSNCKARVIVKNGEKRSNGKFHNHECLPGKEEMLLWSKNLKEKAVSGVPAKNACTTQNLSDEAFAHVATSKSIRSKYYYMKNKDTVKFGPGNVNKSPKKIFQNCNSVAVPHRCLVAHV